MDPRVPEAHSEELGRTEHETARALALSSSAPEHSLIPNLLEDYEDA